ncbi:hypothetical protein H0O02_02280 [Candidatus Micrarchaeota archaeon]|nr:hypothetical protein [Candidatus Micrarchaeota archaeon]
MPAESTEQTIIGTIRITPEPSQAVFALEAALNLLEAAKSEIGEKRYEDAYGDSKNAIMMAAAAIMYNDGYVANTPEGAYGFMEKKYGRAQLVREWKSVDMDSPENRGAIARIAEALGLGRKKEMEAELGARKALSLAEVFIESARTIVMSGMVPAWASARKG